MASLKKDTAYYHLPGLFEFYELYRMFLPLYREHREYFYDWCEIGSIYGAPADCIWGGGRAGFGENDPEEGLELMQEYGISDRLTFSNSLLRQEHLSDRKCNALCRLLERYRKPQNGVIIYSELLLEYLKEQYPGLYFVSSTTKVLTDFTQFEEEIERNNYIEAVAKAYHVGFEELRKLVGKMAVQTGLAKPAERPREIQNNRKNKKEDGILVSQKVLLTWLIESEEIFHQIEKYITPEDFSEGLFRKVAELLYEQYEKHEANPAQIMNHFTDEEEHREVAGLFHTKIKELTTVKEQEKALQETILRVKEHSIEEATKNLDPTDIQGLQRLMNEKRKMQDLRTLHISIN